MGLIQGITKLLFGDGRNVVAETVEVFRESAEKGAQRNAEARMAAMEQFAAEFAHARRSGFDRFVDALNRLPRPMLALGTIGLFVSAMANPAWFADRMLGVALIPEPLWWLMGAIVSFYFGARYQAKGQEFQRSVAQTLVLGEAIRKPAREDDHGPEAILKGPTPYPDNAALAEWWSLRHAA
ncbi:carboxylesterase [Salipiger sp. IMCC34102]|uniref:holin family protein n=1 Tax=Salipiger sp. IMCC34102 TaxID=2510647 RepID=UPI00101BD6C8|nr:holin family protein [Salipiger sp. IMCC34102]RYH03015.1 carboxylesterase [Salipiger sp. IMCC34102]